jgi:hypothetical protein
MAFTPRVETYTNVSSLTTPFDTTVTKPGSAATGDILFQFWAWSAATTIDSVPANWYLVGQNIANTDRYALYFKIVEAGEGASWVWSWAATAKVRGVCSCYTAGDFAVTQGSLNDLIVSNTQYRTSDGNVQAAAMSVPWPDSPLVFFGGVYSVNASRSTAKPTTPTTGWVEDEDGWNTTSDFQYTVCSYIWTGSGTTGTMQAVLDASNTATTKHAFAVALRAKVNEFSFTETLNLAEPDPTVVRFPVNVPVTETLDLADSLDKLRPGTVLLIDPHDDLLLDEVLTKELPELPATFSVFDALDVGDVFQELKIGQVQDKPTEETLLLADALSELRVGPIVDRPTEETLLLADALSELRIGQVKPTTPLTDTADFADGLSDLRIGPVVVKPEDVLTLADALSDLRPSGVKYDVVQETLALTDAIGELKVGAVVLLLADVLSLAEDAQAKIGDVLAQVLDSLGLADDATVYVEGGAPAISVTDSLALDDVLAAPQIGGLLIQLAESLVATEDLKPPKVGSIIIVGTDTVDAADVLTTPKVGTVIVLVNDALVAADDLTVFTGDPSIIYVNFTDALSLTEAINALPSGVQAIVYDALGLTDSIAWGGQNNLTFADALSVLDSLNAPKIGNLIIGLTETLTAAEIATEALGQTTFTVTDSMSAVDVLSKTLSDLRLSLYDDLIVSDDVAVGLSTLKVAVEDTLTLIEEYFSEGLDAGLQPVESLKIVESLIVQVNLLASQMYEVQERLRAYRATPRARAYVATNRKRQFTGKEH